MPANDASPSAGQASAEYLSQSPYADITSTGTPSIDAISAYAKWGKSQGSGATVTYSFGETESTWIPGYAEPRDGFQPLSEGQREAVRTALASWERVSNIDFVEVKETAATEGDLRFGVSSLPATADSRYPGPYTSASDVWLGTADHRPNSDFAEESQKYAPGTYSYFVLVHEIGHTLGAKHPHETIGLNTVLPPADDWRGSSVMSYRDAPSASVSDGASSSVYPTGPMALDVDWIRSIYGSSVASNLGNTSYHWTPGQAFLDTIVDDGGIDTLDWSNQSSAAKFDLRGGWQEAGPAYRSDDGTLATTLYLYGKSQIENAYGGSNDDEILGNNAANFLVGNGGDDRLAGRGQNDRMEGGTGNDTYIIEQGNGQDVIFDDAGSADRLELSTSFSISDLVFVTDGNDLRVMGSVAAPDLQVLLMGQLAGHAIDQLKFLESNEMFLWNGTSFTADPTGGNPPTEGADFLILTDDADTLYALGGDDVVYGKAGNDLIDGGNGRDWLIGGLGDDQLIGGNREDKLDGGDGNDDLFGGAMGDVLRGGQGNDTIQAGDGADTAFGAPGDDVIYGGEGDDVSLVGGLDNDIVYAGGGNDSVDGASGDDSLDGGSGNDLVVGGTGDDDIGGSTGTDTLRGGFGNDQIDGGDGDDILSGGFGNDLLFGGSGIDTALFNGSIERYQISHLTNGAIEVRHQPANGIWYGIDELSGIELVKFGNAAAVPLL